MAVRFVDQGSWADALNAFLPTLWNRIMLRLTRIVGWRIVDWRIVDGGLDS